MRAEYIEQYPTLLKSKVDFSGTTYDFLDLYLAFESSEYGQFQATQQPRFHKVHAVGDYETHLQLIGDDAHPVRHMIYTVGEVVLPAIALQQNAEKAFRFSDVEKAVLPIATAIHDIDECEHPDISEHFGFTVGDVPSFEVTSDDEHKKAKIRKEFFYPRLFKNDTISLPDSLLTEVEKVITHSGEGYAPEAFKYIEKYGYVLTAFRAGRLALEFGTKKSDEIDYKTLSEKLLDLAVSVKDRNGKEVSENPPKLKIIDSNIHKILGYIHGVEQRLRF